MASTYHISTLKITPSNKGMSFGETVNAFLQTRLRGTVTANGPARPRTVANYRSDLRYFTDFMEARGLTHWNEMRRDDVSAFVDWVQSKTGWRPASQFKVFRSLRALFNFVRRDEECRDEAMKDWLMQLPKIPKTPSKVYLPSQEEIRAFVTTLNTKTRAGLRDYIAASLMLDCGLRIGEICHLRLHHLKLDDKLLLVPKEGKTGEAVVPISSEMIPLFRKWMRKRAEFAQCDYLFVTKDGAQCCPNVFDLSFARHRKASGVGDGGVGARITPHTFRHFFATDYLRAGGSIAKLKAITRHQSFDTLQIYVHLANDDAVADEQERVTPLKRVCVKKKQVPHRKRANVTP
jgi:integrase/recombinase XerD